MGSRPRSSSAFRQPGRTNAFSRWAAGCRATADTFLDEKRWRPNSIFWTLLPCAAVISLSAIGAIQIAEVQGRDAAMARAEEIADGIFLVMEDLAAQVDAAARIVNLQKNAADACGPMHQAEIYRAASTLPYIEAIGRIDATGHHLSCSTFGPLTGEIELGESSFTAPNGQTLYKHAHLDSLTDIDYTVLVQDKAAIFVNGSMAKNILSRLKEISLGAYYKTGGPMIFGRGDIDPRKLLSKPPDQGAFFEDGQLFAISGSSSPDYRAFIAFPATRIEHSVGRARSLLLPTALVGGLMAAILLFFGLKRATSVASALKRSLSTKNVFMNYQPIVEIQTRECVGAEALIRWKSHGALMVPDNFIAAAENAGIMSLVTQRVASLVAWDMASYIRNHDGFHVSINLSAADLRSESTFKLLGEFLLTTGVPSSCLWVEITETGVLDVETGAEAVRRIKSMGIRVAVDDFGVGYSSLSMLGSLKVDILKIDRKFTQTIITGEDGEEGSEIVCAIIGLANSLKLEMVAEGVETEAQAAFLLAHGVKYGQGWLFGKPRSVGDFENFSGAD